MSTLNFAIITDARTFVGNSGVIDWNWGTEDDDQVIEALLPEFLYRQGQDYCCLSTALRTFIPTVLQQDLADYDGLDCVCEPARG